MIKFIFLVVLYGIQNLLLAQNQPYRFSNDILVNIEEKQNSFALQIAATELSFIGNYNRALDVWNRQRPNQLSVPFNETDSIYYMNSIAVSARDYIIERSVKEEIVILNELHHNPTHRVFASSILKALYNNGYRYLGLEALQDSLINERGSAIQSTGYYTSEPEFGNFIKEALDIGFVLFGYEAEDYPHWSEDKWKNREIGQAQNIFRFMQENTLGKYFIYCGAAHAFEGDNNGRGKSMAGILSELTGKDPFTIDQNKYADKGAYRYNNPISNLLSTDIRVPSVLINVDGDAFRSKSSSYETDIRVIQPANAYVRHSLDWMSGLGRKEYRFPLSHITSFPVMIKVYRDGEYSKGGVPSAILEANSINDNSTLLLKPGKYEVLINNSSYEIIHKDILVI